MESKNEQGHTLYDWNSIINAGAPFEDQDFPATFASLFDPADPKPESSSGLRDQGCENWEWERLGTIYGENYTVFPEVWKPENVVQGNIGDCYFITCLAALAANPDRVKKLFKTTIPNAAGCYVINLCVNGTWQEVVVDDYVPVKAGHDDTKVPRFGAARPEGEKAVIWVSLLEKAWAKLCGNFERIIMGTVDMGFIHLCGVPSVGYKHLEYKTNREGLFNALKTAQAKKHIMTAGTADTSKAMEQLMSTGLVANHCYSLLSVHDLTSKGKKVQILKLKNPYGGGSVWNGDWCQDSALWTDALRNEVGEVNKSDGVFCMPFVEYINLVSFTNVCKYEDDDCHSYAFKNKPVPEISYFEFTLDNKFQFGKWGMEILVNQMGDRLTTRHKTDDTKFDPSWFSIMLCQVEGQPKIASSIPQPVYFVKSSVSTNYQVHLEIEAEKLRAGKYVLKVEALWNKCALKKNSNYQAFCVQVLTKIKVNLKDSTQDNNFLYRALISRAIQNKASAQVQNYTSKKGAYKIIESKAEGSFYGVVAIINESTGLLEEDIEFTKLEGFKIHGQTGKKVSLSVPAGQARAILLKRVNDKAASMALRGMIKKTPGAKTIGFNMPNIGGGNMLGVPQQRGASPNRVEKPSPRRASPRKSPNKVTFAAPAPKKTGIEGQIKAAKHLRRKELEKRKKVFITEAPLNGDEQYILVENEEAKLSMLVTFKFKCTMLALENPDEDDANSWTIELAPGSSRIRKFLPADDKPKKKGGMSGMGGMMDMYDMVSREFKIISTKVELYEE